MHYVPKATTALFASCFAITSILISTHFCSADSIEFGPVGSQNDKSQPIDRSDLWTQAFLMGSKLKAAGKYAEAEPCFKTAIKLADDGSTNKRLLQSFNQLAGVYRRLGRYDEAIPLYQQALEITEKTEGTNSVTYATILDNLGQVYASKGDISQCEAMQRQSIAIYEKVLGPNAPDLAQAIANLAAQIENRKDYVEAEKQYLRAIGIYRTSVPADDMRLAIAYDNLGGMYSRVGQYQKADPLQREALKIL